MSPAADSQPNRGAASAATGVAQDVTGYGRARQAILGTGIQNPYLGTGSDAELAVSIAPPLGQRNKRFPLRGRDKLLRSLSGTSPGPRVRVVHGLGGCGKTRLALAVAYRAQQRGVEVWWVSAVDDSRLAAGMRAVGRRMGLTDIDLQHGEAGDLVWQRLVGRQCEWLLVIDNADDPQILAGSTPYVGDGTGWLRPLQSPHGLVVVTSRDGRPSSWGPWCRLYRLGMLPSHVAVRVLADHAGHDPGMGNGLEAAALVQRLGGLPLALKIAGSFLGESAAVPAVFASPGLLRSFSQYQEAIEQGELDTAFPAPAGGELTPEQARGLIGRTWELTLDLLETRELPEARRVLRLLACLADAPVPHELLPHPDTLADSVLFAGMTGPRLWQVLQALAGFGLIDLGGNGDNEVALTRLHPLVQDTSRAHASGEAEERKKYLALAAALLRQAAANAEIIGEPEDPATWPIWQALAPHAIYVFETLTCGEDRANDTATVGAYAAHAAARYQAALGLSSRAESIQNMVLAVWLRTLGANHPSTLTTRYMIAHEMAARGDHTGAETEYRDVLAAQLRALGADHRFTLSTRNAIAYQMGVRGDHARAEAECRDILAVRQRVLGADHPSTLSTRQAIAYQMRARGDHAGAEAEYRDILAAQVRVLGADHRFTLITRHELARMMAGRGDHNGAKAEYRDVLATQRRVLGTNHPDTIATASRLRSIALTKPALQS